MTSALPDWFYPGPPGGWTADMLDRLPPDAPRRVELIDGSLIMMSPQTAFHMFTLRALEQGLRVPEGMEVMREMSVVLGRRQRPEPDIMIVESGAVGREVTSFPPEAVRLVVEVVSEESRERDRVTKPIKYSDAGIRYFWRIENDDDTTMIYTFELEPAVKAYVPTGIHHNLLLTNIGFEVDIDLTYRG
ncbi:MAG: Uma2 family endonuclease [Nonomuraea sp.]|nr:Uma2 family endonuclease [Nonomuraea sp.]